MLHGGGGAPWRPIFGRFPLSLYYFNTLTTYSLVLNMLVTPLVTVISLGAFSAAWWRCLPRGWAACWRGCYGCRRIS
ncbi:MAG: hypothetical protein HC767_07300 [Akkermansiaceae bacterium]|nr:hypothetical protein [Akkermansiaceae bacterium]